MKEIKDNPSHGLPPPLSQYHEILMEIGDALKEKFAGEIVEIQNSTAGVSPKDKKFLNALRRIKEAVSTATGGGPGAGSGTPALLPDEWVSIPPEENGAVNGSPIPLMSINLKTGKYKQQTGLGNAPLYMTIVDYTATFPAGQSTTFSIDSLFPEPFLLPNYHYMGLDPKSYWADQTNNVVGQFGAPLTRGNGMTYQFNVWQDENGLRGYVNSGGLTQPHIQVRFVIRILYYRADIAPIIHQGYITINNPNFDPAIAYPAGTWVNHQNRGYVSNKPTGPGVMDKDDWYMEPDSGNVGNTFSAFNSFIVRNGYGWYPTVDAVLTQADSEALSDPSLDENVAGVWNRLAGWPGPGRWKVYFLADGTQIYIPAPEPELYLEAA